MAKSGRSLFFNSTQTQNISSGTDMNYLKRRLSRSSKASTESRNPPTTKSRETLHPVSEAPPPPPPPPAYSAYTPQSYASQPSVPTIVAPVRNATGTADVDSPFVFLAQFDTIFLIDDSGSMSGRSWRETENALSAISPIITEQDADGLDIYFLNHKNRSARNSLGGYSNVTSPASVNEIFQNVKPSGGTPTGTRLNAILKRYLTDLAEVIGKKNQESQVKPLNIIVITDGVATDDVESAIISAAKKLDKMGAEPWQVGIQFFQVGQDRAAAQDLQELDDGLAGEHGIRDMVDTVPWNGAGGSTLTADGIMKVTMGAINRRLDRKRIPNDRLRQH